MISPDFWSHDHILVSGDQEYDQEQGGYSTNLSAVKVMLLP